MDEKQLVKSLASQIEDMYDDDFIILWNDFCEDNRYYEDIIYANSEDTFEDLFRGQSLYDMACEFYDNKDWNPNDSYCQAGKWLKSFDKIDMKDFDLDTLARWLINEDLIDEYNFEIEEE